MDSSFVPPLCDPAVLCVLVPVVVDVEPLTPVEVPGVVALVSVLVPVVVPAVPEASVVPVVSVLPPMVAGDRGLEVLDPPRAVPRGERPCALGVADASVPVETLPVIVPVWPVVEPVCAVVELL